MKIKRTRRNRYVLLGLAVWMLAAAGFFSWFGWQAGTYRKQADAYASQVKQVLSGARDSLKVAHDNRDTTATQDALRAFATNLEMARKQSPVAPGLFGAHIGADDTYARVNKLDAAARTYATDLRGTADFIAYQQKTAVDLQLLSLASAGNAGQIAALATAWKDTATTVSGNSPPNRLKEVHATLVQKLQDGSGIIARLGDSYTRNDEAGFKAGYAELQAVIEGLKPVGEQITVIAADIDAQLAKDAADIAKNL